MIDGRQEMMTEGIYQRRAAMIWLRHNVNQHRADLGLPSVAEQDHAEFVATMNAYGRSGMEAAEAFRQMANRGAAVFHTALGLTGPQIEDS